MLEGHVWAEVVLAVCFLYRRSLVNNTVFKLVQDSFVFFSLSPKVNLAWGFNLFGLGVEEVACFLSERVLSCMEVLLGSEEVGIRVSGKGKLVLYSSSLKHKGRSSRGGLRGSKLAG